MHRQMTQRLHGKTLHSATLLDLSLRKSSTSGSPRSRSTKKKVQLSQPKAQLSLCTRKPCKISSRRLQSSERWSTSGTMNCKKRATGSSKPCTTNISSMQILLPLMDSWRRHRSTLHSCLCNIQKQMSQELEYNKLRRSLWFLLRGSQLRLERPLKNRCQDWAINIRQTLSLL